MVFNKVKEILSDQLKIEDSIIVLEARLTDDLGLDSLDAFDILIRLEDEFGISIDDEAAQNFKTVSDLVNCIEESLK